LPRPPAEVPRPLLTHGPHTAPSPPPGKRRVLSGQPRRPICSRCLQFFHHGYRGWPHLHKGAVLSNWFCGRHALTRL
jgi:hypothetical protein